jgi:transposase
MNINRIDGRSLDHETLEFIRMNAVERVLNGEEPKSVMKSYGLCHTTIYKWLDIYEEGGWEALESKPITGRPPKLTEEQIKKLSKKIIGKDPRQLGMDLGLWTRRLVSELIKNMFGITLGLTSVGKMLYRIGLVPIKPLRRAYERDPEAIEYWKTQQYPKIKKKAKKNNADIYFLDEAGVRSDSILGKTWGLKGKKTIVETSGARQSINIISAISETGGFWYDVYSGTMNAGRFIEVLGKIMKYRRRPLYIILDSLPAHRAKSVAKYVQQWEGMLELYFLPGYAPELNPDEFVYNYVKEEGPSKRPLNKGESLMYRIIDLLETIKNSPKLIRSFFFAESLDYI